MTCIFCNITPDKFKVEYSDDSVVVFHDIRPVGRIHLLVVPRDHCRGIADLDQHHVDKVRHMHLTAIGTLKKMEPTIDLESVVFGFHLPPFVMINHLHLHVIVPPTTYLKSWLYATWFPWFLPIDKAIDDLKTSSLPASPTK